MTSIINLTQVEPTPEQYAEGVFNLDPEYREWLKMYLTVRHPPTKQGVRARAKAIADLASNSCADTALIDGPAYLMAPLEAELKERRIQPLYSFVGERSVESTAPETGEVTHTTVIKHLGFVYA